MAAGIPEKQPDTAGTIDTADFCCLTFLGAAEVAAHPDSRSGVWSAVYAYVHGNVLSSLVHADTVWNINKTKIQNMSFAAFTT